MGLASPQDPGDRLAPHTADGVIADVLKHRGKARPGDDMTLMRLERMAQASARLTGRYGQTSVGASLSQAQ